MRFYTCKTEKVSDKCIALGRHLFFWRKTRVVLFFCLCLLFKGALVKRADGADEVFGREFARFIISPEGIEKFTFLCYNQSDILEFNGGKDALYNEIKSSEDIKNFLEKTNMLHDGYIIDAQYKYYGIEK